MYFIPCQFFVMLYVITVHIHQSNYVHETVLRFGFGNLGTEPNLITVCCPDQSFTHLKTFLLLGEILTAEQHWQIIHKDRSVESTERNVKTTLRFGSSFPP